MKDLRKQIDLKDKKILRLFQERMSLVLKIREIKNKGRLKIKDRKREQEILDFVVRSSSKVFLKYNILLFVYILNLSKLLQYEDKNFSYYLNLEEQENKNLNFSCFSVDLGVFSLKQFRGYKFKAYNSFYSALNSIKEKRSNYLIYRVKMPNRKDLELIRSNKLYLNCCLKYKGSLYFIVSEKLKLFKGNVNLLLNLIVRKDIALLLDIFVILKLAKIKIKKVNIVSKGENFSIYLTTTIESKKEIILTIIKNLKRISRKICILGIFKFYI